MRGLSELGLCSFFLIAWSSAGNLRRDDESIEAVDERGERASVCVKWTLKERLEGNPAALEGRPAA